MSFTSWPLGFNSGNVQPPFKYVNNIISSSSANSNFIAATKGTASTTSIFNVPVNSTISNSIGNYIINDIIAAEYENGTATNQGSSFASQSVSQLQNNNFAFDALTTQGYNSFIPGLFDQFGLVSTIILSMLAYGNTDQLDIIGHDLATQWPHDVYSNMLTINDAMTYIVRQLGTAVDNLNNFANISEWRWMYPQRSRCITPTTLNIVSIIAPTVTPANNIAYPSGKFRWDILRYDFFETNIFDTSLERNTLNISSIANGGDLLIDNKVFTLIYDNVAAPGCILLRMKIPIIYNDGTGSTDGNGNNTSIRTLNESYINTNGTFPTVFRVGFEWIDNFIDTMVLCNPVEAPSSKVLLYGGNLVTSLQNIRNSYLGCKRLYMWRLTHDLLILRLNNTGSSINPVNTITSDGTIFSNSIPGVYLCLLNGTIDYSINSNISANSGNDNISTRANTNFDIKISKNNVGVSNIVQPLWQNFWYPLSRYDNDGTTLVCFTSVEIQAYLTPTLSNENIKPNKYGEILILVNNEFVPIQNATFNQISYTDPTLNTIQAISCYNSTNCWASFNPYVPPPNPNPSFGTDNYVLYIFIFIVIFCILIIIIYFVYKNYKKKPEKNVKTVVISPPQS